MPGSTRKRTLRKKLRVLGQVLVKRGGPGPPGHRRRLSSKSEPWASALDLTIVDPRCELHRPPSPLLAARSRWPLKSKCAKGTFSPHSTHTRAKKPSKESPGTRSEYGPKMACQVPRARRSYVAVRCPPRSRRSCVGVAITRSPDAAWEPVQVNAGANGPLLKMQHTHTHPRATARPDGLTTAAYGHAISNWAGMLVPPPFGGSSVQTKSPAGRAANWRSHLLWSPEAVSSAMLVARAAVAGVSSLWRLGRARDADVDTWA